MEPQLTPQPWDALSELLLTGDAARLNQYLEHLPGAEVALAISRLAPENQKRLFTILHPEDAADVIQEVPEHAVDLIEQLPVATAAAILEEVRSDHQADILGAMEDRDVEAILEQMADEEAEDVRKLLGYPEDTAGGVMLTEYLAYPISWSVDEILADMKTHADAYADYSVQYMYITDEAGTLLGVLRMRDLIFASPEASLHDIVIQKPLSLHVQADLETMRSTFERHALLGLPVVDDDGLLLGVVRRAAVEAALAQQGNRQFLGFSGIVGGEEFRTMPILERSRRRLSWLAINIVLNIVAASVIAYYQETIAAVIALAVFLPMISDMSGCSGNQAVAVSMRELTLGLVRPHEFVRVLLKEMSIGLLNGLTLGLLLGGVALLWKGNVYLGLVVGCALAANTLLSVCVGGVLPLALRRARLDPALVSGPVLTTVTDMCGFFLVLSLATLLLGRLS